MGASIKMGGGGSGRRGRRKKHAPMAEINVTPFVDVMLVLLIIFMVTAPLMATGIPIDLPKTGAKQLDAAKKEPLLISITREGKIFLGTEEKVATPLTELKAKMAAIAQARGGTDDLVHINGDKVVEYGIVPQVINEIMAAGFHKFALRTDPSTGG